MQTTPLKRTSKLSIGVATALTAFDRVAVVTPGVDRAEVARGIGREGAVEEGRGGLRTTRRNGNLLYEYQVPRVLYGTTAVLVCINSTCVNIAPRELANQKAVQ